MATDYTTTEDQAAFQLLMAKFIELRDMQAAMGQEIVTYTDAELAALQSQINLLDSDGVAVSLAKIEAFLNAVDSDGDNVIDSLAGLISDIEAAASTAQSALDKASANEGKITSVQTVQSGLQSQIDTVKGDVAGHKTRLEALEAAEDNAGLSEAQVRVIATEEVRSGLTALAAAVPDFVAVTLNKTYPITGDGAEAADTGSVESI